MNGDALADDVENRMTQATESAALGAARRAIMRWGRQPGREIVAGRHYGLCVRRFWATDGGGVQHREHAGSAVPDVLLELGPSGLDPLGDGPEWKPCGVSPRQSVTSCRMEASGVTGDPTKNENLG